MKVEMELESKACPTCGLVYAVPTAWFSAKQRQFNRGDQDVRWYCPNGHETIFGGEAEAVALRRERDQLKQQNAMLEQEAAAALAEAEKAQAEVMRRARRAVAGVCPCCNRSFRQLAHHMRNKHPGQMAAPPGDFVGSDRLVIAAGRSKGGFARAAKLSPEQRRAAAQKAAQARWRKRGA